MAAAIRATLARHLIITVVILADGQWCLSAPIDSENHAIALKRMAGATARGFNLVATGAPTSTQSPTSDKVWIRGKRRLSREQNVAINPNKSTTEVEILMAFKSEINYDPMGVLDSWRANDSDPCGWSGVGCSPSSTHVTTLNLSDLHLEGTVSTLIGQLLNLQHLDLSQNYLYGSIPASLGNCSNLLHFNISFNDMYEGIPPWVGNLDKLQTLDLSHNSLTGPIPEAIGNCSALQYLDLGLNILGGCIPSQFGALSNLNYLNLRDNSLSGSVPPTLGNCKALIQLRLESNSDLGGELPFQLRELIHLQGFAAYGCSFEGKFPMWILNLTSLHLLDLGGNRFAGQLPQAWRQLSNLIILGLGANFWDGSEIPHELGSLTNLEKLDIANSGLVGKLRISIFNITSLEILHLYENHLTGAIPDEIGLISNLNDVDLSSNRFSSILPSSLSNCSLLQYLQLESNHFRGTIPVQLLGNFYFMQYLDFSDNKLGGTIPAEISQLVNLQQLYMFANQFVGALPDSLGNCTQLLSVDFSNNRLTGSIPGEAFAAMSSLTTLDLSSNLFSGSWPSQFGGLQKIRIINVSANNISGAIPLGLGGCLVLESLDLSFNQFSGVLPGDLGFMVQSLSTFNASYNNFSGPIPSSFWAYLSAASFLGNPGLCGDILGPQRLCPVEVASPITGNSHHCNGFECPLVWISVVSAVAFVIILLGALYISSHHYGKKLIILLGALYISFHRYGKKVIILLGALYISSHRYEKKDNEDLELVTFTNDPSMRFCTKFDILSAIGAGEDAAIGHGPKSIVYKANLPCGGIIAIKVLKSVPSTINGEEHDAEFLSEAHTLVELRHRNIIKVVGLYYSKDIKAFLLEYMPKGSLHANLHGNAPCKLTWAERFRILLGVTHGMVYLHHEFPDPIIHRDLKPSNILLDADLEPKLCDFGISKFVAYDHGDHGEVSASSICGTFGYMPPEYGTATRASTKGDVYSFGVVLLELLTAKAVASTESMTTTGQDEGLVDRVQRSFQKSPITLGMPPLEVLDPSLRIEAASDDIIRQKIVLTLQVGLFCTRVVPRSRPSMNDVLEFLLEIEKLGQRAAIEKSLGDLMKEDVHLPKPDHELLTCSD